MSISQRDFLSMQARLSAGKRSATPPTSSNQLEVGSGGIQEHIEDYLKSKVPNAWWDRKRTDKATTSRVGTPDFVGFYYGVGFGLEAKRPGKKPTTEQLGELKWMELAGAKTGIAYSLQDAIAFFESIKPSCHPKQSDDKRAVD